MVDTQIGSNAAPGFPQNPSILFLRGRLYLETREFEKAIADFRTNIEINDKNKMAALSHSGIAEALLQQNDFEGAIQEYQNANLPEYVLPLLDNRMCMALLRKALPASALPYCNRAVTAVLGHRDDNVAEFYDSRAFALWQLQRMREARINLLTAKRIDERRPNLYDRLHQFRTLIVEIFLQEKGYITGNADGVYDQNTEAAVKAYQMDEGLPVTNVISNDLVGSVTTLGFGIFGLKTVKPYLYNSTIVGFCKPATRGEFTTVRGQNGVEYICNSDGTSVRSPFPAQILPRRLKHGELEENEWLRCYDPQLDIVFSLDPSSVQSCAGNSYRISEEDYLKIVNGEWPVMKQTQPPRIEYGPREEGEWLRCYDPEQDIVFSFDPWFKSCGVNSYRISEDDFQRIMEEKR